MRAGELVVAIAAAAALAWVRRAVLKRRAIPPAMALLAEAIPDALGDGILAVDGHGRIGHANTALATLVGATVSELLDVEASRVAPEVAALAKGAERGPAAAHLTVPGPRGPVRVRAAVVRVRGRPPWSLAVLRPAPELRPSPPPLPTLPGPSWSKGSAARAGLAAAAAALNEPLAKAGEALSILRLASPPLGARAAEALAAAEAALELGSKRIAELAAAGRGGPSRALDLAALAADFVATSAAPPGVRLRFEKGPQAPAHVDDRPIRAALREVLAAAVAASPPGGEIVVAASPGPASASLVIRVPSPIHPGGLSLARALVAPQGGRVEEEAATGRSATVRISLARPPSEPA